LTVIIDPTELGNSRFEVRDANLRYFAAKKATITVGGYAAEYQICQIVFGKSDGSIFLSAPYFRAVSGIVARVGFPSTPPYTASYSEHGKVTSHLVKFAHHPDGRVHFSQRGKVRTEIIGRSFLLPTAIGNVFELHVFWPWGFEPFLFEKAKPNRLYLRGRFRGSVPNAFTVTAQWRQKSDIMTNVQPAGEATGPIARVRHRKTGAEGVVTFVGQPRGFPLTDHVLLVTAHPITTVSDISEPTMILMAGCTPRTDTPPKQHLDTHSCLLWMYPVNSPAELRAKIGSIDLTDA
jgi:hypothetical protein